MKNLHKLLGIAALAMVFSFASCPTGGGGGGGGSGGGGGGGNWKAVDVSGIFGTNSILSIAYGNGTFVAVGDNNGKIAYSSDGVTWTAVNTGYNYTMSRVTYGNGKFVAGTYHGSGGPRVVYSSDGKSGWTELSSALDSGDTQIRGLAYGNGKFIAAWGMSGKISTSTDGITWTSPQTVTALNGGGIYGIAYGGLAGQEKFVAVGYHGMAAYSSDGTSWATVDTKLDKTLGEIECIVWGKDKFVAAGTYNRINFGKMTTSPDGINWTLVSDSPFGTNYIHAIAYGNGKFVVVGGEGKIAASSNGTTWTLSSNSTTIFGTNSIYAIAYGNNTFVAGGENGKIAYSKE
jgi:hypothetical protein